MRSLLSSFFSLALLASSILAAPASEKSTDVDGEASGSKFNGQDVPPMTELSGTTLDEGINHGYWLVEYFSPYCHHCKALAPTWQTLYEFYYTSQPLSASSQSVDSTENLNSFTRYYDFRFGKVDCVAFADTCSAKDITSYPTIILYKDGKEQKRLTGTQSMETLSKWVEETLEVIRPGSRPAGGPKLPKPGATEVEGATSEKKADTKEKGAAAVSSVASSITGEPSASPSALAAASGSATTPKEAPNPLGTSLPLTAEKFQSLVTNTRDSWFVKFYAPWCHHCQAMAPNWAQMAREMQGKLQVGEVNCDAEKRLCKDAHVKGYPTMLFFRGGERVEYDGLRGVGDLIGFASKAIEQGSGVQDVDEAAFEAMEEKEEVIFIYFYDHATTNEDFQALERLTLSLIGHARLVKTKDMKLAKRFGISTWPRLAVSRDGKASYYQPIAPKDMRDVKKVLLWMKSVWLPLVPELTSSNAREIMDGKLVVLAVMSRDRSDEFIRSQRELKNAAKDWMDKETVKFQLERQELRDAKALRIEEAEDRNDQRALRAAKGIRINMEEVDRTQVAFAWVDGVFWERWIRTTYGISVKDGERVIINDEDNRLYYDVSVNGEPIRPSRTSIVETLQKIVYHPGKIPAKSTTSRFSHALFKIRNFVAAHPWLSLGIAIGIFIGASIVGRNKIKRGHPFGSNTGSFFQLDGKEGLLGTSNTSNGKVD